LKIRRLTFLTALFSIVMMSTSLYGQLNIRYVNSVKIFAEYKEAQEVQKNLAQLEKKYRDELTAKYKSIEAKNEDYKKKQLVLSEDNKKKMEEEIAKEYQDAKSFEFEKFGPEGELYTKQQQVMAPINAKVNVILQRIAIQKGYDYIFDIASAAVVYAKDIYDVSNLVIEELNKEAAKPAAGK
jgi:outer membrane protein